MSLVKSNGLQIGQSVTATNNFTLYQPASPDGTVRWGVGNSGSVTDIVTLNSSGNVGIGTSSPARKLNIQGDSYTFRITEASGTSYYEIGRNASDGLLYLYGSQSGYNGYVFGGVNGERMRLDSSGNLGLGVTPSAWGSAYKVAQITPALSLFSATGEANFASNIYIDSGYVTRYLASNYATQYQQINGQHIWYRAPSGTAGNAISFTQAMTLSAGGNLGVGTTSPSQIIHVKSTTPYIQIERTGVASSYVGTDATGMFVGSNDAIPIYLNTSGLERMRIDASGNVGIGTISPSCRLNVANNSTTVEARLSSTANVYADLYLNTWALDRARIRAEGSNPGSGSGTGSGALSFWVAQNPTMTEVMRIDSSGNLLVGKTTTDVGTVGCFLGKGGANFVVSDASSDGPLVQIANVNASVLNGYRFVSFRINAGATQVGTITTNGSTTTAYNTSSDYRLKENIQPMQGALAVVQQLNPVTYTWKSDGSDGQGFIAHELQAVVPDCVTGEKDAVDAEGNPVYQGIDTSFLVATLTAAIQELNAKLDAANARIEQLEAK